MRDKMITVDAKKCTGCKGRKEPLCVMLCPGDLMALDEKTKKAYVRNPADCWDCMACVKACPFSALETKLPYQIGYYKARLIPKKVGNKIIWSVTDINGKTEIFECRVRT